MRKQVKPLCFPVVSDLPPLSAEEDRLWRSLGRIALAMPRALDDDMVKATGLSMTDYAVLIHLAEAPGYRLRMTEIAEATGLSASRITRVVDDLIKRGLVAKERHAADARGTDAVLTEDGLRRQQAASGQHLASARRRVMDLIPPEDVPAVAEALRAIADDVRRRT